MPNGRLTGKVAIITGAAGGQGAAEARHFVAEGAAVVLSDIAEERGEDLASSLGEAAVFVAHDVSDPNGWRRAVQTALKTFGRLTTLVNNAGYYRPVPMMETSIELWQQHIDVNQLGVMLGIQHVVPVMPPKGFGCSIVNVGSVSGTGGFVDVFAYSASKWAVRGMTRCAARELAYRGIRVNTLHPGVIDTEMLNNNTPERLEAITRGIPLGRIGVVDEIASTAVFLASDESSFITGAEFMVDGGRTA